MESLKTNGTRLNTCLQTTCSQWGAIPSSTGMHRLALSKEDKAVRDWLVKECQSVGCTVKIDEMGNIFATRPGSCLEANPIAMGSHLDTQPAGGRYDGILGVLAALEVLRTLHENDVTTFCPIALIDWTNEEGARFPGAMMSSGVWSQKSATDLAACYAVKDLEGTSLHSALEQIGYLGTTPCDYRQNPVRAHFELHIEQGPLLEKARKRIGVVTAVQGMKWFAVRVSGVEGHSGTTPMNDRSDALVTAAKMIASVRDTARDSGLGVATVGVIKSDTQSQATIPSGVEFVIDVRCSIDPMVTHLCRLIFERFDAIVAEVGNSTRYEVTRTWGLPESRFDSSCISCVREAASELLGDEMIMEMKSAAGHDSAWTSKVVPTSMIFVPSKDGVSHNPNEFTSEEDCGIGAQVLLKAVLRYDGLVRSNESV